MAGWIYLRTLLLLEHLAVLKNKFIATSNSSCRGANSRMMRNIFLCYFLAAIFVCGIFYVFQCLEEISRIYWENIAKILWKISWNEKWAQSGWFGIPSDRFHLSSLHEPHFELEEILWKYFENIVEISKKYQEMRNGCNLGDLGFRATGFTSVLSMSPTLPES